MENTELLTCGDNSCMLDHPKGMATNGGCQCLKNIYPLGTRLRLMKYIQREKQKVKELENKLKILSDE